MEKPTGRKRNYSAVANGSEFYVNDGFRFDYLASPAPTAASSPASSISSLSKVFSFAQILVPSILTRNDWLGSTAAAQVTSNGSQSSHNEKRKVVSRHPLGLDAYLSDDDEDSNNAPVAKKPLKSALRQTPANSQRSIAPSPLSVSNKDVLQSRQFTAESSDGVFLMKKPKLSFDVPDSDAEVGNGMRSANHRPSRSRTQQFWMNSPDGQRASSVGIPAKVFPVAESPAPSMSSSRSSYWDKERSTNIFSVAPRTNSSASVYGGVSARPVPAQRSRPTSVTSNPPVVTHTSRERTYQRARAYNSEMKRIQKDLERASRRQFLATDVFSSSDRDSRGGLAAGSAGFYGSARQSGNSYVVGEAQSIPRLATLSSSVLYRPVKDYSSVFNRGSKLYTKEASNTHPDWVVSSGPVFRFAKPFPVDVGKRDGSVKQNFEPSVFRFGLPQPAAAFTEISADETAISNQTGRVRFNLPLTRNRADGNF